MLLPHWVGPRPFQENTESITQLCVACAVSFSKSESFVNNYRFLLSLEKETHQAFWGTLSLSVNWGKPVTALCLLSACMPWFATDHTTPYYLPDPPCFTDDSTLPGPCSHLGLRPWESHERLSLLLSQITPPAHYLPSHLPQITHTQTHTHTVADSEPGCSGAHQPIAEPVETRVPSGGLGRGGRLRTRRGRAQAWVWRQGRMCRQEHSRAEEVKEAGQCSPRPS